MHKYKVVVGAWLSPLEKFVVVSPAAKRRKT
jgi:hypothetical protein